MAQTTTTARKERIADRWRRLPDRWRAVLLLALPFLAGTIALRGLTRTMPTFHAGDEVDYHLPTIVKFAHELPGVDLVHYAAAQTPLFHLLVAAWSEVVGLELWRLRVVEVLISYGVALVLYRLLRRHAGLGLGPAVLLAALFACSPYVFGQSFILVTDNLALLFGMVAIERLLAFDRGGGLTAFAVACGAIGLAVLTRQSSGWLAVPAFLVLVLHEPRDLRLVARGTALLGLALVPFGLLALSWHGLVPPTADPASCGLCAPAEGRLGWAGDSRLRAPLYAIAIAGVYGTLLHGPALWDELRRGGMRRRRLPLVAAAGGVAVLLIVPLAYHTGDEGWIWRVARSGPQPLGTAWPFWLLVPLGCAVLAMVARRCGPRSLPVLLLGCFLVAQLATRLAYQKYFDPIVLLTLLLALRPEQLRDRRVLAGVGAIALLSAGFVFAFVTGAIQYES
ncbi:MAG: ArnT family glycosyltransferase [Conexibacter sp.]